MSDLYSILNNLTDDDIRLQLAFFDSVTIGNAAKETGAPVELEEVEKLEEVLPVIWDDLAPEAQEVINRQGVVYTDEEGDLVTSIVNGKDCVFTCYDEKGYCYCAIEKAYREGKCNFYKPISCHLYPIRIGDYGPYKAVNYHRWQSSLRGCRLLHCLLLSG